MSLLGFLDIENDEIEKYMEDVKLKRGICKILPIGRFNICRDGYIHYGGLVCSYKMGGKATGVGAERCINCKIKKGKTKC